MNKYFLIKDKAWVDYHTRRGMLFDLERERLYSEELPEARPEPPEWTRRQFDIINQLRGQMIHLEKKVIKLYEKKKGYLYE